MIQDGVTFDLEFLRSLEWIQSLGVEPGGSIHLQMPGIGLDGQATVDAIEPCPPIEADDGTGRMVVTGTMKHLAPNICDLHVTGLSHPIGLTTTHPVWSESRHTFVQAEFLQPGEQLKATTGVAATVISISRRQKTSEYVYNLEVDGEHVYHISTSGLLVHNENCVVDLYRAVGPEEFADVMSNNGFALRAGMMEVKQFGRNLNEIIQLADEIVKDAAAVIRVRVPRRLLDLLDQTPVDEFILKSGTVTVTRDTLRLFNSMILELEHAF
jgi:hypothetical protein